jgi:hypothetical protein
MKAVFASGLLALAATGCGDTGSSDRHSATISRATFKGTWPFTVSSGVLRCEPPDTITFSAGGKTYAVNGPALDQGIPNVTPIWKRDGRTGYGPRLYLGDVNARGHDLCEA